MEGRAMKTKRELAAFICEHVFDDSRPVLLVVKDDEGDWQLLCGAEHSGPPLGKVVGLNHLLDRDPSINEVLDLDEGWEAERISAAAPWGRRRSPAE